MQQYWSNWNSFVNSSSQSAGTCARHHGWVFVGPCHPWAHGPPANVKNDQSNQLTVCYNGFHTHTHRPLRENFSTRRGETSECETWNTNIELENRCRHDIQLVLWNAKTEQLSNCQVFRVRQFTHVCYGNLFLSSLFVCVFVRFTSW